MEKPPSKDNEKDLSIVLGGGGAFGIGYHAGVLNELEEHGINVRAARMLGTSAGSWAAGFAATEKEYDDIADMPQTRVPNREPEYVRGLAREIFGQERASNVQSMAVRRPWLRYEMLNGDEHDLADIVWASSSVPFIFRSAHLETGDYYDGGVRSMMSADLAPPAENLLAIAAIGQHTLPRAGSFYETQAKHELAKWRNKHDGETYFVRPNRAIGAMVRGPKDLFDVHVGKDVYWMAREQVKRLLREDEPASRNLGKLALSTMSPAA